MLFLAALVLDLNWKGYSKHSLIPVHDHSHQTEIISSLEIGCLGMPRSFRRPAPTSAPRSLKCEFRIWEFVDIEMSLASEELAHKEPRSSDWRRYSCSLSANTIRPGLRRAPAGRRPPSNDRGTQYLVNGARKNKDLQHDSHSQDRQRKV
ncbi:hypothetical protein PSTG_17505, partial [Puccinia striiformis f. sp. tritici PST-78]